MQNKFLLIFSLFLFFNIQLIAQTVTTLASGVGIDDALVLDSDGNLYGSNYDGSDIFKMTPDGVVSSFASGFNTPNGLAFDSQGLLYMADNVGNQIFKIQPDGTVTSFIDNFFNPSGLLFKEGTDTLIATSYMDNQLSTIATDSSVQIFSTETDYNGPVGLCYDEEGNLYIANYNDHKIFKMDTNGAFSFFAEPPGSGPIGFITYANGYIYATMFNNHKIFKIDLTGTATLLVGSTAGSTDGDASVAKFNRPNGILASVTGDSLYVSDYGTKSLRLITDLQGTTSTASLDESALQLQILPNPMNKVGQLNFQLTEAHQVHAVLVNQYGQEVRHLLSSTVVGSGAHQIAFDVDDLETGIYYCLFDIGEKWRMVRKFVVAK